MDMLVSIIQYFLIVYFVIGILAGVIIVVDKYFMIRRYPLLASSCMYDILLKDNEKNIKLGTISKKKAKLTLSSKYRLENKEDVNKYLFFYFNKGKVKDYSEIISYLVNDDSFDEKSDKVLKRFREMKNVATKYFRFEDEDFYDVKSASAYEYSNIGYIIKLALRAKYINEKTAIKYLRILKVYVDDEFEDWIEYSTSFLIGRCIKSSQIDEELIYILDYLVFDSRSFWSKVDFGLSRDDFFAKFEY